VQDLLLQHYTNRQNNKEKPVIALRALPIQLAALWFS
jgi:hypothetical protein